MYGGLPDRSYADKASSFLRGSLPRRTSLLGDGGGSLAYKHSRGLQHGQVTQPRATALSRQRSAPTLAQRGGAGAAARDSYDRLVSRLNERSMTASHDMSFEPQGLGGRPESALRRSSSATTLGRAWEGKHPAPADKWSLSGGSPVPHQRPPSRGTLPQKRVGATPDLSNLSSSLLGAGRPLSGSFSKSRPTAGLTESSTLQPPPTDETAFMDARVQKYSDLFDEVIQRDRIFGSLLGKIKAAYDDALREAVLSGGQRQKPSGPSKMQWPPPAGGHAAGSSGSPLKPSHHYAQASTAGAPCSDEPTRRAQKDGLQELQHENRVLKDLIERLHMELEAAMQREKNWKDKAQKQRPRPQGGDAGDAAVAYQQAPAGYVSQQQQYAAHVQHYELSPEHQHQATMLPKQAAAAARTFNAAMREPEPAANWGYAAPEEKSALNQGGILSLSSISQHTSPQYAPMDYCGDSARSTDSGMLPQCPTRRHVVKPANVPPLDLSKVPGPAEEEEEEEEDPEGGVQYEGENMECYAKDVYGQDVVYQHDGYGYDQEVYEQDSYNSAVDPRTLAFGHDEDYEPPLP